MSASGPDAGNGAVTPDEPTFEEALGRLEEIVDDLEGGQMLLEDSLKRFEEGMRLRDLCTRMLREAEVRIEQVLAESADGENPEPAGEFRLE